MVVAAPAWATSGEELSGRVVKSEIKREPTGDKLVWKLTVVPAQDLAAGALSVTFTGVSSVIGLKVRTKPTTWTGDDLTRRVYPLAVSAGEQLTLEAEFTRDDNAANETATATFTGLGMTGQVVATASY